MIIPHLKVNFKNMLLKQRGVVAVEFALVLIPLLLVVIGLIEFGRTFWYYDALVKSTRDAARYVSEVKVSSTLAVDEDSKTQAKDMVFAAVTAARVPDFFTDYVVVSCEPADCIAPNYVTVSIVNYPVTIGGWIPFVFSTGAGTWDVTLSPSTTMRYMR